MAGDLLTREEGALPIKDNIHTTSAPTASTTVLEMEQFTTRLTLDIVSLGQQKVEDELDEQEPDDVDPTTSVQDLRLQEALARRRGCPKDQSPVVNDYDELEHAFQSQRGGKFRKRKWVDLAGGAVEDDTEDANKDPPQPSAVAPPILPPLQPQISTTGKKDSLDNDEPSKSTLAAMDMDALLIYEEIQDYYQAFPLIREMFSISGKIGEGTFSSVYKARRRDGLCYSHTLGYCDRNTCGYVAIKRIYRNSSPQRIFNEFMLLKMLEYSVNIRECDLSKLLTCDLVNKSPCPHPGIVPFLEGHRYNDEVAVVLPYFEHLDFRAYYLSMTITDIQYYMWSLLYSLSHVHHCGIIHRDIKPSNFLYSVEKRRGVLVDFGLAHKEETFKEVGRAPVKSTLGLKGGYIKDDPRPPVRAARAGTRGFRAPEVLLKVVAQTCAIDLWSCGVIFLCLLTRCFPFFRSDDDSDALLEIIYILGLSRVKKYATSVNRRIEIDGIYVEEEMKVQEEEQKDWMLHELLKERGLSPALLTAHLSEVEISNADVVATLRSLILQVRPEMAQVLDDPIHEELGVYDFLQRLLDIDPKRRITAEEGLHHPFLKSISIERGLIETESEADSL